MVSAFLNTVKIPELRRRILFTLAVIVVVRLGAAITTPGVNPAVLQDWFRTRITTAPAAASRRSSILFSGGALENCAIFSLGIMPYISASIMMQLLTAVIPSLGRLAREDGGRQKIMQIHPLCDARACAFFRAICWRSHSSIRSRITRCCLASPRRSAQIGNSAGG